MLLTFARPLVLAALVAGLPAVAEAQGPPRVAAGALPAADRPFGTLREQAAMQQAWLKKRLDTFLPALDAQTRRRFLGRADARVQRRPGLFARSPPPRRSPRGGGRSTSSSTSAQRPAPRRRPTCVERIALGGTSQGGLFDARTSAKAVANPVNGRQAELWGDEQWLLLKQVVEERKPKVIGIDRSTVFAFSDGLSSGELQGMSEALGASWTSTLPQRRTAAARADRVAPAGGGSVLREDERCSSGR